MPRQDPGPATPRQVTDGPAADYPATRTGHVPFFSRRRTRKLLATHPWVEDAANVESVTCVQGYGDTNITFTAADGTPWLYNTQRADQYPRLGKRPVWIAGTLGGWVAISLTEGKTVSRGRPWIVQHERPTQ